MNTAQIILSQIKAIDPMALFAWGAKEFVDMGEGLKFKSSGVTRWKGQVYIKYNKGNDLYDIEFFKLRNAIPVNHKKVENVFADSLVEVIDRQVG